MRHKTGGGGGGGRAQFHTAPGGSLVCYFQRLPLRGSWDSWLHSRREFQDDPVGSKAGVYWVEIFNIYLRGKLLKEKHSEDKVAPSVGVGFSEESRTS